MLTPDARFEGWSPTDWSRLLSLFRATAVDGHDDVRAPRLDDDDAPRGGLVVMHDAGRIRKALHTVRGRIDPRTISWPPPAVDAKHIDDEGRAPDARSGADAASLAGLAHEQRALWVWTIRVGALEELMERFGARVRRGDDALTQALIFFTAFRELLDEGSIESWPRRLEGVPVPTRAVVDRALDALVPAGRIATIALYDRGDLWTSLVLRRAPRVADEPARFDAVVGPMQLRRDMGLVSGDFRRDYRFYLEAVRAAHGPIALGVHAEVTMFRRLITVAKPGDWARAAALRDLVLDPVPAILAVPLGLDATRGAIELASKIAQRIDPIGILQPLLRFLGESLPHLPPSAAGKPGFDPFDALRKLLTR